MEYEVIKDRHSEFDWRVEGINYAGEGEGFVAIFSGTNAEALAREYHAWKTAQVPVEANGVHA